jgi:hypothetical protein
VKKGIDVRIFHRKTAFFSADAMNVEGTDLEIEMERSTQSMSLEIGTKGFQRNEFSMVVGSP